METQSWSWKAHLPLFEKAVPVERMPRESSAGAASDVKMTKLVVIANQSKFEAAEILA